MTQVTAKRRALLQVQAEGMSRGIEADPHVLLWLESGQRRALRYRVRDARLEVVDLDLQVHHHLLVTGSGWPDGTDKTRLGLEAQRPATCLVTGARLDHDPAGLFRACRPAEQAPVEIRERVGVRRGAWALGVGDGDAGALQGL